MGQAPGSDAGLGGSPSFLTVLRQVKERVQELHQDQGAFEESSSLAFVVLTKQVKSLKEAYSQLADSFLEEMERVHSLVHDLDDRVNEDRADAARGRADVARSLQAAEEHAAEQFQATQRAVTANTRRLDELESLTHKVAEEFPPFEQ